MRARWAWPLWLMVSACGERVVAGRILVSGDELTTPVVAVWKYSRCKDGAGSTVDRAGRVERHSDDSLVEYQDGYSPLVVQGRTAHGFAAQLGSDTGEPLVVHYRVENKTSTLEVLRDASLSRGTKHWQLRGGRVVLVCQLKATAIDGSPVRPHHNDRKPQVTVR